MEELKIKVNGIEITYMQKARKYDTKHLIVIFSGFGGAGEFTYDFRNVMSDCPAEVLWIKDCFNNHCSYYMCTDFKFEVETAVHSFIESKLRELNLDKENCTFAGFSKGASAAIYFGVKYDYKNIVTTVPQFYIGSYVDKKWKVVAENMMGEVTDKKVDYLDNLIPEAIQRDKNRDKNIYILTSPEDDQYKTEIVPNIPYLEKYNNFNLLVTNSVLVREHAQVTQHHLTVVLGVFYSLCVGLAPKYGKRAELITDQTRPPRDVEPEHLFGLKEFRVEKDGILYINGYSVIKGKSCSEWGDVKTELIFSNSKCEKSILLAKGHRPNLTRELYSGYIVNYDRGWFATANYKGVDITNIPDGEYKLLLRTECKGVTVMSDLIPETGAKVLSNLEGFEINERNGCMFVKKK